MTATIELKPYSILITDDDRGCREALCEIVASEGFRTLLAESGEEALEIIREERIHLALLDMHMPRLTGLETMVRCQRRLAAAGVSGARLQRDPQAREQERGPLYGSPRPGASVRQPPRAFRP
jgi:CheY-like chemotaxis protein